MGTRTQGGWKIRIPAGSGRKVYVVRFRHAGQRIERSTGCTDPGEAAKEAARIYADTVSGRRVARPVAADLQTAVSHFLADLELEVTAGWAKIVGLYFEAHLIPFFASLEHFTPAMYADYGRQRLQKVSRPSVRKELCALRRFVAWCADHELVLPAVPALPKHGQPGKRAPNARKRKATIVTEGTAKRILLAMPDRSRRTGERVRDLFVVLWETGLRPTTVLRLEAPLHYRKGSETLFVSREIDKEGFERTIPLSPAAQAALDRACPAAGGRIFRAKLSSLRHSLAAALKAAGLEDLDVSPYDFRHSRITAMANAPGPLTGASYLAGHKHASTTALYIQGGEQAARETLAAMQRRPAGAPAGGRSGGRSPKTASAKGGT